MRESENREKGKRERGGVVTTTTVTIWCLCLVGVFLTCIRTLGALYLPQALFLSIRISLPTTRN
ncbi:hypothetical protein Hdeb2414_s0019g00544611 [Helianthus debilis subsp. tardiflorus]